MLAVKCYFTWLSGFVFLLVCIQFPTCFQLWRDQIQSSTVTIILNIIAQTWFITRLLANLVEKSEVHLDVSKYSKKWFAWFEIILLPATFLAIFCSDMKENLIYFTSAALSCQIMISMLLVAYLITTNLVCTSFIEKATDLSKEKDKEVTMSCSISLVNKLRILKSGFSTLIFHNLIF